jgi:cell division septum initiation protein DivIVA
MENEERILQILTEMQQDMSDIHQDIAGLQRQMTSFEDRMTSFDGRLEEQTVSINLYIENSIGQRLDALYDGLMLGAEKHEILEHRVDAVEKRVDRLEVIAI